MRRLFHTAPSLLLITFLSAAAAETELMTVFEEDFDAPVQDFEAAFALVTSASTGATAEIALGDVAGSQGVVYGGTWDLMPGGVEFSSGTLQPLFPPAREFMLDPAALGGIVSISYTVDTILNGFVGDTVNNLFLSLVIYQLNKDGSIDVFTQRRFRPSIENTTLETTAVATVREDFRRQDGRVPDLGPDGLPLSFGIQLGALFNSEAFTGFEQGHLSIDNWTVVVEVPDRIFRNGFEAPPAP